MGIAGGPGLVIPVWSVEGRITWWQCRPDHPRSGRNGKKIEYVTPKGAPMRLDVHPSMKRNLGNPHVPLFITEGIMKGDALTSLGLCTVSLLGVYNWRGTGPDGGITALGDWESVHLHGRRTYIVYDSDVMQKSQVQNALRRLHEFLRARGADLRLIYLPYGPGATKTGVDDFMATGNTVDDLLTLATDELREMPQEQDQESIVDAPQPRVPVPPMTLAQVEQVYAKWLGDHDLVPLRTVLAAVTANLIMGSNEPVWIMVVGGSGFGKTETIAPLSALPLVHMASSISSEGALLSATPKRDKAKGATGGLLAQIGSRGLLVLKDFTTILSMNRDARAQIIAAFREIADGRWERSVGTDGGRKLVWEGKIGMVAAATAAIDNAHTVLSEMGSRFTFVRMGETEEGTEIAQRALANVGHEAQMRKELSDAYRNLLETGSFNRRSRSTTRSSTRSSLWPTCPASQDHQSHAIIGGRSSTSATAKPQPAWSR
jgi:hypothetical protein